MKKMYWTYPSSGRMIGMTARGGNGDRQPGRHQSHPRRKGAKTMTALLRTLPQPPSRSTAMSRRGLVVALAVALGSALPAVAARGAEGTPADRAARVELRVPADAQVWVDGARATQTGPRRTYAAPPLVPG